MITKAELKQSAVVFDEATHTYRQGDRELSGITSLIHSVLLLGVYPDATDYVKKVQIPKAGYYGTCVHKAIQMWDELGIEVTKFPEEKHPTAGTLPAQDVSDDLETYKRIKPKGLRTIACEFTVSYGNFSSQIDKVSADENDDIYLVDYKTNNLDYYPGGKAGLQEYLSWQLSCYAVMFEQQTGLKVKGLIGNWMRKGAGELWRIERKPDELVQKLLSTEIIKQEWGGFTYYNPEMQVFAAKVEEVKPVATTTDALAVPVDVVSAITTLLRAEKAAKAMKEKLRELMEAAGVTKWECPEFTATIGKPSETTTFDSKAFQADHPDLYEQYLKTTTRKGSFTQKLK
jgi:hypothetical protein